MCMRKKATELIKSTLTSCDLVRTVSYSLFPRTSLNLSKLGMINKTIIFSSGLSSEYDVRSVREWEEQAQRFLKRGAIPTFIVVPVLIPKNDKNGKVYHELKGYRDANLFSASMVYGDPIKYDPEPTRFVDLKALSERFNLDLGDLPEKLEVISYYNESGHEFEICEYPLKRLIYNIVLRAVKLAVYRKQSAKDRLIVEILTLAILRSMGFVVVCNKDYHAEIQKFGLYQKLSTNAAYFSLLKGIEVVWETIDMPVLEM